MTMNYRMAAFVLCMVVRFTMAYLVYNARVPHWVVAIFAACVAVGFASIYIFNLRETAFEAGGEVWWGGLRPVHSAMYLLVALLATKGNYKAASCALAVDTAIGGIAYIAHSTSH